MLLLNFSSSSLISPSTLLCDSLVLPSSAASHCFTMSAPFDFASCCASTAACTCTPCPSVLAIRIALLNPTLESAEMFLAITLYSDAVAIPLETLFAIRFFREFTSSPSFVYRFLLIFGSSLMAAATFFWSIGMIKGIPCLWSEYMLPMKPVS